MTDSVGSPGRGRHPARVLPISALCAALTAHAALPAVSPGAYPKVERAGVVEDFHGTKVADPYRWLEALDSPQTQAFVAGQNAVAEPFLKALPDRERFRQRLTVLYQYERFGLPLKEGANYFYQRNDGKQDQAVLYVSDKADAPGRVLIDPNKLRGDATVSLADYKPSPDGKLLAYSLSDAGSDWNSWYVRDVATGQDRPDHLVNTKFTPVSWARDGSGFYYSVYPKGDDQLQPVVHFHKLGDPQAADREIYAIKDHPTRVPYGTVTEDGRYLVLKIEEGTKTEGVLVMALDGSGTVTPLFTRYDGMYEYLGSRKGAAGTELLFKTNANAPNGHIVAADMGLPPARWGEVRVPESKQVLESAALVGDRLVGEYLQDASSRLRQYAAADGKALGEITLPGLGSVAGLSGEPGEREAWFSYTDFSTPTRTYSLDTQTGATTLLREPKIPADISPYVTEQVFYTSRDGTRVPMFIVHRRDAPRDGTGAVMLYGYGGFDISMTPSFSSSTIAWLERGGTYAVANLRGGGEYGAAWHEAGTLGQKQNVFDDFIGAAEYLVKEKYAAPKRIVIRGGSNGGLLVGAVMTQRPELFGAALPAVGVLDMLRYHLASANARQWSDDYGLSDNAADFKAQFAYSPVHNADRQTCYPPTLITTGAEDNRVVPWHSFKFAAALQHAQKCGNPVLLRVETRAGHGAGKPMWMQIEGIAEEWAFAAAALGLPAP
jgi:prolyl oligopeptidase